LNFPAPPTLLAGVLLACSCAAAAQVSLRDDLGRPVQVKHAATRIVTLAPFLTELVFAAGAGDKLVGVASLSDFPPEAKKLTEVTTGDKFSLEQIAGLAPDLVLAWRDGIRKNDVERMSAFGATVFVAQARSLADVARLLKVIGLLTGRRDLGPPAHHHLAQPLHQRGARHLPRGKRVQGRSRCGPAGDLGRGVRTQSLRDRERGFRGQSRGVPRELDRAPGTRGGEGGPPRLLGGRYHPETDAANARGHLAAVRGAGQGEAASACAARPPATAALAIRGVSRPRLA
jgi:hypothetical protein